MPLPKYQTPSSYLGKKPAVPRPPARPALPGSTNWAPAASWGWTGSPDPNVVTHATPDQYPSPYPGGSGSDDPNWGQPRNAQSSGRWISPDYSGILGSFTADARNRFGAGLEDMKAQRLSQARSLVNRLGVRDVPGMLEKLKAFGLTQADLQGAADNPWSELKGIERQQRDAWNQATANRAARGGFRSGGTIGARERIDQDAARAEAQYTQETLGGLSEGMFKEKNWEREQRDAMEQAIAAQQAQLAAAYQPYWQYD